ncbi:MAG: ABC transporter ATP-binding protein/permease [Lachnospiraceae bacterium]|nr:ABC transporter ATP-binding protein/permease [Lachnospiraceae bacterium]
MEKQQKEEVGIRYLLALADRKHKQKIYIAMVCSVLAGFLAFVPFVCIYRCVAALFHHTGDFKTILSLGIITLVSVVLRFILLGSGMALSHVGAYDVLYSVRTKICNHIGKINLGFFSENSMGEVKRILMEDVERLEIFLAHQMPDVVAAIVIPVVVLIYLFTISVPMSLILMVPVILTFALMSLEMFIARDVVAQIPTIVGRLNSGILQFISGMTVMKTYNLTADSYDNYRDAVTGYNDIWVETSKKIAPISAILKCLVESGVLFTLPFGGYLYVKGSLSMEDYIFFLIMGIVFLSSFNNILNFAQIFSQISSGIERVRDVMEIPETTGGSTKLPADRGLSIELRDVDFAYTEESTDVLHHLSVTIPKGKLTAFVGASGAGKTTAAQLIPRFWDVNAGHIYIEGIDIREIPLADLMDHMSFVFQEAFVLNDTVYNNIVIGKQGATEEEVYQAAKAAQIHDFIVSLPEGYQTRMGSEGVKFSGGERQRLCIARAILKDAPIIVFDEATSFTDGENEHKIQMALDQLLEGKTTIMVAHRLHTIMNAEQICVFRDGEIVEYGKHQELVEQQGEYAKLWATYSEVDDDDERY